MEKTATYRMKVTKLPRLPEKIAEEVEVFNTGNDENERMASDVEESNV